MQKNKPDYYNDLDKVYVKIWELLKIGLQNRDLPFHIPVFICGYKGNFDGRIVVLRGVDEKEKKIWFHSDIRSNKIKILKSNPEANLLFYDKNEKIQLRISGIAKINYQNHISKKSWEKTAHMSRQCYLGDKTPGSDFPTSTSGLSENINHFNDYLSGVQKHVDELGRELARVGVDYTMMNSSEPLDKGLFAYLAKRSKTKS